MLELHFNELVEELEISAGENERAYRVKVALLAGLGYAYVLAAAALMLGAAWLAFGMVKDGHHWALLQFAVPMALLSLVGLRALWVRFEPPEGTVVKKEQAPQLFALLEMIRGKLDGPPIHQVLMNDEYNAAIMQVPRFGILGGTRNYLIIGLPLVQSLSLEQLAAVLGHEYGHLSGAHGKFSAWIYRVRMTWAHILDALQARPMWGSGIFLHFFRWYVPYFQAYTFVLARSDEYAADRAAADVAGAKNLAEALVTLEVGDRFMVERFWPTFMSGADKSPAPAFLPYTQLPLSLNVGLREGDAQAWLKAALLRRTGVGDTHPSLKDRLSALGEMPALPAKGSASAAKALFGPQLEAMVRGFDKAWAKRSLREWTQRHNESQALKERAAQISQKAKSGGALTASEWTEFGHACARFASPGKAEGYFRKALELTPDYPEANLAIAEILLDRRDASALPHLDRAIAGGGDLGFRASIMATHFLRETGRDKEAQRYEVKTIAHAARENEQETHRVFLLPDDNFAPHGLTPKELALCRAAFKRLNRLHSVHAACKVMPGAGELHLVFVVQAKVSLFELLWHMALSLVGVAAKEDTLADDVAKALRLARPFTVFQDLYLDDAIEQRFKALDDSLVFEPE